jgi:hypothetical protein
MLDPWIIEEILKKEEERRKEQDGPRPEAPLPYRPPTSEPRVTPATSDEPERGVMIIDI